MTHRFTSQLFGFFSSRELAEKKLEEIQLNTDYYYEIRSYDEYSWYLWRLDKKF